MEKLRYKRVAGGIHRHKGRKIRKGDVVEFYPGELSDHQMRRYECLDKVPSQSPDLNVPPYIQETDNGKFNIVNGATGKNINTLSLTKREADKFGELEIKKYKAPENDDAEDNEEEDGEDIFDVEDDEDED